MSKSLLTHFSPAWPWKGLWGERSSKAPGVGERGLVEAATHAPTAAATEPDPAPSASSSHQAE